MGDLLYIKSVGQRDDVINITPESIAKTRCLREGLITDTNTEFIRETAEDHTSEPIKRIEDINRIAEFLLSGNRYRDYMLFIVGINLGLRVSDLIQLRFSDFINSDNTFKLTFPILEKKTTNTRKVKRNRYLTINDAVVEAICLYLEHNQCKLDDFLFRGESNRADKSKPITRKSVDRIIKGIAEDLNLEYKVSTHTLRKTFGYHQMMMDHNDPRRLLLLQKMFGHSSSAQTLDYIGLTGEEVRDAYLNLNLGTDSCYIYNAVTAVKDIS